jgi:hypothetical protein
MDRTGRLYYRTLCEERTLTREVKNYNFKNEPVNRGVSTSLHAWHLFTVNINSISSLYQVHLGTEFH